MQHQENPNKDEKSSKNSKMQSNCRKSNPFCSFKDSNKDHELTDEKEWNVVVPWHATSGSLSRDRKGGHQAKRGSYLIVQVYIEPLVKTGT